MLRHRRAKRLFAVSHCSNEFLKSASLSYAEIDSMQQVVGIPENHFFPHEINQIQNGLDRHFSSGRTSATVKEVKKLAEEVYEVKLRIREKEHIYIHSKRPFVQEMLGLELYALIGEKTPKYRTLPDGTGLVEKVGEMDLKEFLVYETNLSKRARIIGKSARAVLASYAIGLPDAHSLNFRVSEVVYRIDFENAGIGWGSGIIKTGEQSQRDLIVMWESFFGKPLANNTYVAGDLTAFVKGLTIAFTSATKWDIGLLISTAKRFEGTVLSRQSNGKKIIFDAEKVNELEERLLRIRRKPKEVKFELLEGMFIPLRYAIKAKNEAFVNEFKEVLYKVLRSCPVETLTKWHAELIVIVGKSRAENAKVMQEIELIVKREKLKRLS